MSWITDVVPPKIKTFFKRETPENLWIKCPDSGQVVFQKDVESNQWVIPSSGHHMRLSAIQRLKLTFDDGQWAEVLVSEAATDPLKFRNTKRYTDRLKEARTKTGLSDAIKVGIGSVEGLPMTIAAHDPDFIGGLSEWPPARPSSGAPKQRSNVQLPVWCLPPLVALGCRRGSCPSFRWPEPRSWCSGCGSESYPIS